MINQRQMSFIAVIMVIAPGGRFISWFGSSKETDKPSLLAASDAVASIRPQEARVVLVDLIDSDDEDIAESVYEAMAMAERSSDEAFDEEEGDKFPR